MQTEEMTKKVRQIHRMTMATGAMALIFLLLVSLNQGFNLFLLLSMTDCSFG